MHHIPFVAEPVSIEDPDDTVVFVSSARLHTSYEFCGMFDDNLHQKDVHPLGLFLVVMVPQVSVLIKHFQFLTIKDLLVLASGHGLMFNHKILKDTCHSALLKHHCNE